MQKVNFYLGLCIMLIGLAVIIIIPGQSGQGDLYGLSPGVIPTICSGLLVFLALILVLQNRPQLWLRENVETVITGQNIKKVGTYIILALIGILLMQTVGYIFSGFFIIASHMFITGERSPIRIAFWSILPPLVLYGLIYFGLEMPLP